jgi:hypothetical protein
MRAASALLIVIALALAGCSGSESTDSGTSDDAEAGGDGTSTTAPPAVDPYGGHQSETYADLAVWMCHPDLDRDACDDLDATAVAADGSTEVQEHVAAEDPAIDCFYIYPTISTDPGANSDLVPSEDQEIRAVRNQVARMNEVCEVYAPVYRQRTLTALTGSVEDDPGTRDLAYNDVLDAWKHYISNHNEGRGVVLVGHSQGSGLLTRLIAEEIDTNDELRPRLVSAYLLGSSVAVPEGEVVGGAFQNVPLCTSAGETGCVVTYASFRSTAPPPADSFFGRTRDGNGVAGCVNPAALVAGQDGGRVTSVPYFVAADTIDTGIEVDTPWVTYPDFLEVECVSRDGFNYLEVTVNGDPSDPRTDDIAGDLTPVWGLHLVDANLTMGDQVALLGMQAEAFGGD